MAISRICSKIKDIKIKCSLFFSVFEESIFPEISGAYLITASGVTVSLQGASVAVYHINPQTPDKLVLKYTYFLMLFPLTELFLYETDQIH